MTEIVPVFSRKPLFGYKLMVWATVGITALSFSVWAHHMFATFAGLYFRFPEITGRMMDEPAGQAAFLDHVHRTSQHVPGAPLAGRGGHAPPPRRLPAK